MTTPKPVSYGRTPSGVEITEEFIERAVAEAEAGYDISELRRRAVPPNERNQVRAAAETVIEAHGEALERLATSEE
jgi:acyl-CoA reductase-like NAD-dependent aldehyde dehydrogenase